MAADAITTFLRHLDSYVDRLGMEGPCAGRRAVSSWSALHGEPKGVFLYCSLHPRLAWSIIHSLWLGVSLTPQVDFAPVHSAHEQLKTQSLLCPTRPTGSCPAASSPSVTVHYRQPSTLMINQPLIVAGGRELQRSVALVVLNLSA